MSTSMARKRCTRCGEQSLAQEWVCWACGMPFAASSSAPTVMPSSPRGQGHGVAAAVGILVLLIGIGLGFWMARVTGSRSPDAPPEAVTLPALPPGVPLVPAPPLSGGRPAAPVRLPPPPIGARPPGGDPWRRSAASPMVARTLSLPPPRSGFVPPSLPVPRSPRVKAATPSAVASVVPSHGARAGLRPDAAHVRLINKESVPLSVEFHGPEKQPMIVAPGPGIPVELKGGSYRLIIMLGTEKRSLGSVTLENGKSYTIPFNRSRVL